MSNVMNLKQKKIQIELCSLSAVATILKPITYLVNARGVPI